MACRGLGGRLANAAPPPFPFKLYDLVEAAVERGICSWTSTEFVVWDKELLCCTLLPLYFRHDRLDSFQRQLYACVSGSARPGGRDPGWRDLGWWTRVVVV